MDTCYRHPARETGLHCSNCGRAICPECMTHAAVGIRCPECAGNRPLAKRAGFTLGNEPFVTRVLIAANVPILLATTQLRPLQIGPGRANLTPPCCPRQPHNPHLLTG